MVKQIVSAAIQADRVRVGATLRTLRRTRGWTLCDFAAALGISHPYLSNIEAGRKPLPDHLLARASRALEVEQIAIKHPDRTEVSDDSANAPAPPLARHADGADPCATTQLQLGAERPTHQGRISH